MQSLSVISPKGFVIILVVMDTVSVKGINYEKASLLAKEFKYTSDYLGQLCRARKVDCQLIGRTWYINRDSLVSHRTSRYSKNNTLPDEKTFEYNVKINKSRVEIEPFLKNNVIKMVDSKSKNFISQVNWKPARYELDKDDLLPSMLDKNKIIKLDIIEDKKEKIQDINIKNETRFERSPSIALNGDIKITSFDHDGEVMEATDKKNIGFTAKESVNLPAKANYLTKTTEKTRLSGTEDSQISLIPKKVKQRAKQKEESKTKKRSPFILIMLLITLVLFSLFIEFKIEASSKSYDTSFQFSPVTFDEFFLKK